MAGAMTVDGRIVRIDRPMPWVGRLLSLPLLAASFYLLWNVALGLRQDFSGFCRLADDLMPVLVFTALGLLVVSPGIILLTFRPFVVLNETLRQIVITRQFGPLNFRNHRDLADYHFISITDEDDPAADDIRCQSLRQQRARADHADELHQARGSQSVRQRARASAERSCATMSAPSLMRTMRTSQTDQLKMSFCILPP